MKNKLLLICILLFNIVYSQQTYPLNSIILDVPKGSYFKDLDGELNPYIGLWKGSWNGKTVYLELKKVKYLSGKLTNTHYIYYDMIFGERKIINTNGSIEIDKITNFDNNQYHEFSGINKKFSNQSQKQLYFAPDNMCGKTADLDLTFLNPEKTQMSLHLIYRPSYMDESCPYYNFIMQGNDYPINFPKDIVLTKQ